MRGRVKMKNRKYILAITALFMMLVTTTISVCAEALGDGWTVGGYNPGWILVGIAIVVALIGIIGYGDYKKFGTVAVVALLIGVFLLIPYETTETPVATITDSDECCDFEITGSVVASGTDYIGDSSSPATSDPTWDDDTLVFTVPLYVADSSDGQLGAHNTGLNLTFDPVGSGKTSDDICTIHFSSDYSMKLGGEEILDEDSTGHQAIWTVPTSDGTTTKYHDHSLDVTANDDTWAQIDYTFNNNSAGNWVTELDQIGDTVTWYITAQNDCGTWSETIAVQCIVTDYTA